MTYIIFSTKFRGFVGTSVPYTSDHKMARSYTREAAVAFCSARNTTGEIQFLPINLGDL